MRFLQVLFDIIELPFLQVFPCMVQTSSWLPVLACALSKLSQAAANPASDWSLKALISFLPPTPFLHTDIATLSLAICVWTRWVSQKPLYKSVVLWTVARGKRVPNYLSTSFFVFCHFCQLKLGLLCLTAVATQKANCTVSKRKRECQACSYHHYQHLLFLLPAGTWPLFFPTTLRMNWTVSRKGKGCQAGSH